MVPNEQSALVRVIWLKVPRTPFAVPCSYLDVDGIPKMPIRVGTVTKYLTPLEAVEHYRGRLGQPIHPEEVSRNVLARNPVVLKETIETNLLEITRPPTTIATSKTDATTEAVLFERNGAPPFPLRLWNGNVVSLRSKEELARYCGPDSETASESADEFIKDLGGRRVVLGLLNLELLSRADSLGFMVDWEKQRVFFRRRGDVPVKHSWQSFSRRANRTVVGFVPGPEGIPRYWYHFGAYLKTKYIAGHFFVTLSPTWVFTKDGTNLIDRERSQSLSASKLNRERNDRVLYNLHLWYQLLSENKEFIDLPLAHGQGRVEALPVTCSMDRGIEDDSIQTSELELDMDSELPGEEQDSKEDDELDDVQDGLP
jgi:hypothetical protein